jgi:hypothetical protein
MPGLSQQLRSQGKRLRVRIYTSGLRQKRQLLDFSSRPITLSSTAINVWRTLRWKSMLLLNGFELDADIDEQERAMLRLAAGECSRDEFTEWVELHVRRSGA